MDKLASPLAELHRYWHGLASGDGLPSWQDFDLSLVPPTVLPSTMVIDIAPKIEHSVFRFWGSRMTDVHGADHTGKCPYDLQPPALGARILVDHRKICETNKPNAAVYGYTSAKGFQQLQYTLHLPLSDDGERITQIIAAIDFDARIIREMKTRGIDMQEAVHRLKDAGD